MSKTTSNIASWVIGIVIVLLYVSCVSNTVNDSGCAQNIDQYGACVVGDQS